MEHVPFIIKNTSQKVIEFNLSDYPYPNDYATWRFPADRDILNIDWEAVKEYEEVNPIDITAKMFRLMPGEAISLRNVGDGPICNPHFNIVDKGLSFDGSLLSLLPNGKMTRGCFMETFSGCVGLTETPSFSDITEVPQEAFRRMFEGCTNLEKASEIAAKEFGKGACEGMFKGCTSLKKPANMPNAYDLGQSAFDSMYKGCSSLAETADCPAVTIPANCFFETYAYSGIKEMKPLPASRVGRSAYAGMFEGCTNLEKAAEIDVIKGNHACFKQMFKDCKNLKTASKFVLSETYPACCQEMYSGCESLTNGLPSVITAKTYEVDCCQDMFRGTAIAEAPDIKAEKVEISACYGMYSNCENLEEAPTITVGTVLEQGFREFLANCKNLKTEPKINVKICKNENAFMGITDGCPLLSSAEKDIILQDNRAWIDEFFSLSSSKDELCQKFKVLTNLIYPEYIGKDNGTTSHVTINEDNDLVLSYSLHEGKDDYFFSFKVNRQDGHVTFPAVEVPAKFKTTISRECLMSPAGPSLLKFLNAVAIAEICLSNGNSYEALKSLRDITKMDAEQKKEIIAEKTRILEHLADTKLDFAGKSALEGFVTHQLCIFGQENKYPTHIILQGIEDLEPEHKEQAMDIISLMNQESKKTTITKYLERTENSIFSQRIKDGFSNAINSLESAYKEADANKLSDKIFADNLDCMIYNGVPSELIKSYIEIEESMTPVDSTLKKIFRDKITDLATKTFGCDLIGPELTSYIDLTKTPLVLNQGGEEIKINALLFEKEFGFHALSATKTESDYGYFQEVSSFELADLVTQYRRSTGQLDQEVSYELTPAYRQQSRNEEDIKQETKKKLKFPVFNFGKAKGQSKGLK